VHLKKELDALRVNYGDYDKIVNKNKRLEEEKV
jgi:hypothetical protein